MCLADTNTLSEISLDGNPFASDATYRQTVLRFMQQLRQLDMKRITVSGRLIPIISSSDANDAEVSVLVSGWWPEGGHGQSEERRRQEERK